jgi:hypothetical protein
VKKRVTGKSHWTKNLTLIAQYFIRPLIKFKPEHMSLTNYLEWIFQTPFRTIETYKAKESFMTLGEYVELPGRKRGIPGKPRRVREGQLVWYRHDSKQKPDVHELSFLSGRGQKEVLYRMNNWEWPNVKKYLELTEDVSQDHKLRH